MTDPIAEKYTDFLYAVFNKIDQMYKWRPKAYYDNPIEDKNARSSATGILSTHDYLYHILPKLAIKHNIPAHFYFPHRHREALTRILNKYHQTAPEPILIKRYQAYLGDLVAALKREKEEVVSAKALTETSKGSMQESCFDSMKKGYGIILDELRSTALFYKVPIEGLVTQADIDSKW